MNKKVFGLCDLDLGYAKLFSGYVSRREGARVDVLVFTNKKDFEEYLHHQSFDVLIISEAFAKLLDDSDVDAERIPISSTYILTDTENPASYSFPTIYRYQSSEKILKHILKDEERPKERGVNFLKKKLKVVGIFSPVGRCGKTSLTLALAKHSSSSGRVLCLSLEEYCGHEEFINGNCETNISDCLYDILIGERPRIKVPKDMTILAASNCPEDIRNTETDEICKVITEITGAFEFDYVFIDIGSSVKESEKVLEICDAIYMPAPEDKISVSKLNSWREYMSKCGRNDLINKTVAISSFDSDSDAKSQIERILRENKYGNIL